MAIKVVFRRRRICIVLLGFISLLLARMFLFGKATTLTQQEDQLLENFYRIDDDLYLPATPKDRIVYYDTPTFDGSPRYVLLSTTLDAKYGFFTPITTFLWSLMGWTPVVVCVGTPKVWQESPLGHALIRAIIRGGGKIEYLAYNPLLYRNYNPGQAAQISRLLAGFMDTIPEDAYVLLADGDMWPLQPLYFTIIDTSKAFSIMNANDYRRKDRIYWKSRRYPLTNVGALKTNWKHLVQLDKINSTQVIHGYRDFVKSNGMIVCRLMSLGLDASLTGKDINDLLPAMLWKFMRMERANELIKRKIGFEFDEFSFVWYCPTILIRYRYLKKSKYWYDDIQFLRRNVSIDRLCKYSRDSRYQLLRGERSTYTERDFVDLNSLVDAHVGIANGSVNHNGI